jgi:hypothetical protein
VVPSIQIVEQNARIQLCALAYTVCLLLLGLTVSCLGTMYGAYSYCIYLLVYCDIFMISCFLYCMYWGKTTATGCNPIAVNNSNNNNNRRTLFYNLRTLHEILLGLA